MTNINRYRQNIAYKILVWMTLLLGIIILISLLPNLDASNLPFDDYPHYWAAGRLLLQNENPYDIRKVVEIRNQVGQTVEFSEDAAIFLYPPWALPIMLPFGMLPYLPSRILWFLLQTAFLVVSVVLLWKLFGSNSRRQWVIWIIVVTFFPTIIILAAGHINPVFLLSFILLIPGLDQKTQKISTSLGLGFLIMLVTIKFHLHYMVLLAIFFWILKEKRWNLALSTVIWILISTLIATLFNPQVVSNYSLMVATYPFHAWATPTIGGSLRYFLGIDHFWLQFVAPVGGSAWFIYYWVNNHNKWKWLDQMPIILLASALTAAYGWTGDYVILLIPIVQCLIYILRVDNDRLTSFMVFVMLAMNFTILVLHSKLFNLSDFWFFWFAPALVLWYIVGGEYTKNQPFARGTS